MKLLDLFCGAGGASMGYSRAGFEVTGVDIKAQPNYPFDFHQGDALAFLDRYGGDFDAIHTSPPCQASSALTKGTNKGRVHEDLIPATRAALQQFSVPTVIENVKGAALRKDILLCGEMFSLAVLRHRFFEFENCRVIQPPHPPHRGRVAGFRHGTWYVGPYFAVHGRGGGKGTADQWRAAMGIDWMLKKEVAQAIPPAYTEYIGSQILHKEVLDEEPLMLPLLWD
jgi:hypothetical protein